MKNKMVEVILLVELPQTCMLHNQLWLVFSLFRQFLYLLLQLVINVLFTLPSLPVTFPQTNPKVKVPFMRPKASFISVTGAMLWHKLVSCYNGEKLVVKLFKGDLYNVEPEDVRKPLTWLFLRCWVWCAAIYS